MYANEKTDQGDWDRQDDEFRDWVTRDGSSDYPAEPGRYHLYVSLACPWAHRTVIVRKLKRLQDVVGMTVVDPIRNDEDGWAFREGPGHSADPVNGWQFLKQAYTGTRPGYDARVTVPVLWDKQAGRIVSNVDEDIMRMLNAAFDDYTDADLALLPDGLVPEIDRVNDFIYPSINDGVYRSGFATTQDAYDKAVAALFDALNRLEERLSERRYLVGRAITEADWRLFPTLIRFDAVYHGHFKCNIRRLIDYPNLYGYTLDLYQQPGVADTVDFDHIKRHYYITHDDLNPTQVVPLGPDMDLTAPHGRDAIG
ncbi:glutathione S-transferase family protein [Candidatus Poribacteria bacterium]|jgi:glutathionyl-hydroquinone reductase|nr:glutathione S-transferase family protein [Candidatus Poribacteria bacterium]MBT5534112.1 glutathione S-transferase family protein [Candidatus Poribacteria bacterium]MBT7101658.1 glutathione S-transferase family protein [Candidatus Poribacteria bacterium]MBT7806854.1 glutathione S-transferase family protein [Candidatus Poribacteria bacterium]